MQVFASNCEILAMGSPKVKNRNLPLYESLGDKLTVSLADKVARLAYKSCISGMDLGRGDCQPLNDTHSVVPLKSLNAHFHFSRKFEALGLLNN